MKQKPPTSSPHASTFLLVAASTLLVVACAFGLRWVNNSTAAAQARTLTFDAHYVWRTISAGAVGSYGLVRDPVGVEGIRAVPDEAVFVSQTPVVPQFIPGKSMTLALAVKNRSTKTWPARGASALRLVLRADSASALRHRWWKGDAVAKLSQPVAAGAVASLRVPLTGPVEPGYYEDTFELYQGERKIPGGTFVIGGLVGASSQPILAAQLAGTTDYTLVPGAEQTALYDLTNVGRLPWKKVGPNRVRLVPIITTQPNAFRQASWTTDTIVGPLPVQALPPGATTQLAVPLKAPTVPGNYSSDFQLVAAGLGPIDNSTVRINMTVSVPPPPTTAKEPSLRVGLFSQTTAPTATIKATGAAKLVTTDGAVILDPVTDVTLSKNDTAYVYTAGTVTGTTALPLRVEAPTTTVLQITSWDQSVSSNPSVNYNAFRGTLEFRTAESGKTWIINELPIETYLAGLAESGGTLPLEYRKTIITAARSYALFHAAKKTKHGSEHYDVNATTDQVYKGYTYEIRTPGVSEAVTATRGMVLFHPAARSDLNPDGIALAAYSACTDGRTRSFQEAFGGDGTRTPYLVSVPDPGGICTNARYLQGLDGNHMVGISGKGAVTAARAGKTYDQILAAYYTGILLQKYYD